MPQLGSRRGVAAGAHADSLAALRVDELRPPRRLAARAAAAAGTGAYADLRGKGRFAIVDGPPNRGTERIRVR